MKLFQLIVLSSVVAGLCGLSSAYAASSTDDDCVTVVLKASNYTFVIQHEQPHMACGLGRVDWHELKPGTSKTVKLHKNTILRMLAVSVVDRGGVPWANNNSRVDLQPLSGQKFEAKCDQKNWWSLEYRCFVEPLS